MGRHAPVIHATRRPTTIEAMQLTEDPQVQDDIIAWALSYGGTVSKEGVMIACLTVDGNVALVMPGWYLLRGTQGEFYPCKQDIFESTYDVIDREFT